MKSRTHQQLGLAVSLLFCSVYQSASATDSDVILNLEGSPSCSTLAINIIMEAKDPNPPADGLSDTVNGPDGQSFFYTIGTTNTTGDTVTNWNIVEPGTGKPVDFVVLKAQGNAGARVFHFSTNGANSDTFEVASGKISSVSFCYGLSEPATPTELPPCEGEAADLCPSDPTLTKIITQFDESTPNWNVETCSCGATFTECNPEIQAGNPGACTNGDGALQFLPVEVQLGRDPDSYYCTIIGGTRICYSK